MEGKVIVYRDQEELAERFSALLMERITLSGEGRFDLAISGGSTPQVVFKALAAKYADSPHWQKTHFWWVDERMVPPDHPESNFGIANRLLFSKISIPEKNIHRIKGENEPYHEALSYAQQILAEVSVRHSQQVDPEEAWPDVRLVESKVPVRNGRPIFDLIILGLGDDGHTASIFPDQLELLESDLICAVAYHPVTGQARVTLTGKQINHASEVCFLVTGANKAERLSEIALNNEKAKLLPASHIHPENGELFWYCDASAVELLR